MQFFHIVVAEKLRALCAEQLPARRSYRLGLDPPDIARKSTVLWCIFNSKFARGGHISCVDKIERDTMILVRGPEH